MSNHFDGAQHKKGEPEQWGQSQAAYLAALRGQPVQAVFLDGKAVKGTLTGVDTYDLFVTQSSGLELMVAKAALKYLAPATGDQPEGPSEGNRAWRGKGK